MADDIDNAWFEIEHQDPNKRAKNDNFSKPSRMDCLDCGDDIPEARQKLGGVLRCVDCQDCEDRRK